MEKYARNATEFLISVDLGKVWPPLDGGSAPAQATLLLWRSRRACPRMDVYRQSLVRGRSGRALDAVDIRSVTAERSSL